MSEILLTMNKIHLFKHTYLGKTLKGCLDTLLTGSLANPKTEIFWSHEAPEWIKKCTRSAYYTSYSNFRQVGDVISVCLYSAYFGFGGFEALHYHIKAHHYFYK